MKNSEDALQLCSFGGCRINVAATSHFLSYADVNYDWCAGHGCMTLRVGVLLKMGYEKKTIYRVSKIKVSNFKWL